MSTRPIVNDALWRCLCPSFVQPGAFLSTRLDGPVRATLHDRLSRSSRRPLSTTCPNAQAPANSFNFQYTSQQRSHRYTIQNDPGLALLPTPELYERLRSNAVAGRYLDVFKIIKILVKDRREAPNLRLYTAILHSFVDPEAGTAGKIRKIIEEMMEEGIDFDSGACHAVLEALAVHPDYLLREEILAYMKQRWFTLSDRGHNMVVAGLLRDRLFEQALQKLEDMIEQRIRVADWLLDKAIWILLDFGEMEEAWQLLQLREESTRTVVSHVLWAHFLDVSAQLHHLSSATHIWSTRVIPGYLKPPSGTCMNLLNMAARTGNVQLATDVFRVLGERNTVLTAYHYEMMLEAYLNADKLKDALSIILITTESNIKLEQDSLAPLYAFLKADIARPMEAFGMLQDAEAAGKKVPTSAVNACLRASVHFDRLEEAIDIYKVLHTVSHSGPDTETYRILLHGCQKSGRRELAVYIATEMSKLGVSPSPAIYEALIRLCCDAKVLDDALAYYEEMRWSNWFPGRSTFEKLIQQGVALGDTRTPKLIE
ncbi:hypothetical protein M011DRAFT_385346, partial [Sporormia fimetaria CBS 119925]